MKNKKKAKVVTLMILLLFLAVLYGITIFLPGAWRVYGWAFGVLGVVYFAILLFRWVMWDPEETSAHQAARR